MVKDVYDHELGCWYAVKVSSALDSYQSSNAWLSCLRSVWGCFGCQVYDTVQAAGNVFHMPFLLFFARHPGYFIHIRL